MNWPATPAEWGKYSYDINWIIYLVACLFIVIAVVLARPCVSKRTKQYGGGGGEYQRLVTYGIGWKESKKRKNPWPKKVR